MMSQLIIETDYLSQPVLKQWKYGRKKVAIYGHPLDDLDQIAKACFDVTGIEVSSTGTRRIETISKRSYCFVAKYCTGYTEQAICDEHLKIKRSMANFHATKVVGLLQIGDVHTTHTISKVLAKLKLKLIIS